MDVLKTIREDLGAGPLARIDVVAKEAGVSKWTLLKAARSPNPNPRYKLISAMQRYYERKAGQ